MTKATTKQAMQKVHDWTNGKIVYDISVAHPDGQGNPTPYADLTAALGNGGANIPEPLRKGGMSVKFIKGSAQSNDNKYVKFFCTADEFTTDVTEWQGVDEEPTAGSDNLVQSGGVAQNLLNVITLSTITSGGVLQLLNVGEYGYNTTENKIYLKTDENGGYTRQSPIKNAIYRYQGVYYKWNGTSLVEELNITGITKEIYPVVLTNSAYIPLVSGHKYYFKNQGNNEVNIFARVTSDSENITIAQALRSDESVYYTALVDTSYIYLGYSGTASILFEEVDTLIGRVTELEKNNDETPLFTNNNAYNISIGEKVIFKNKTNSPINVFVRVADDSENINVATPLAANSSVVYTAEIATSIVRVSEKGAVVFRANSNEGKLFLFKGIDDVPVADSENLLASGGAAQNLLNVIVISIIANSGVVSALNIGEYGFNGAVNKIYYKTSENSYTTQNPIKNAIYRYNNCYYKWDGSNLVKELDITEIASNFNAINEQLYYKSFNSGSNVYNISNGETIIFFNSTANPINVFVRETSDSENIDVAVPLNGGEVVLYTASINTTIVRTSDIGIKATRESDILGKFVVLEEKLQKLNTDIVEVKDKVQRTLSDNNNAFSISQGEKIVFHNPTSNDINVFVRVTESSENIAVSTPLKAGDTFIYEAEVATTIVRCSSAGIVVMRGNPNTDYFANIEKSISNIEERETATEQLLHKYDAFINTNTLYNIQKGESVVFFNFSNTDINVFVRETSDSENIGVATPLSPGNHVVYIAKVDTTIVRVSDPGIKATRDNTVIGRLCVIENRLNSEHPSPVDIVPNTDLKDVSALLAKMDYHNGPNQTDVLEQIYALFDELCALHPDNIIKYDPMSSVDTIQNVTVDGVTYQITIHSMTDVLSKMADVGFSDYPEYAKLNGSAGQIEHSIVLDDESVYTFTYDSTPSYKTYMYKLVDNVPTRLYTTNPKKKVLMTGGVHGNEIAAPFNLYMLVHNLLVANDEMFTQMRSQFDFYIVPCVNGYGMYHVTRGNANRVNVNRNFPTGWVLQNNNLTNVTSKWDNDYSGPSAASEFETQLIMALHSIITPVCAIDHHNYSKQDFQFYTEVKNKYFLPLTYRALVLCSLSFRKGLPSYFGNDYKLYIGNNYAHAPIRTEENYPSCGCYYGTNTVFGATVEISECINYDNGQYTTVWEDDFGNDTFSVAEYTLRTQLALYLNEILKL